jgi:hypothetical protein
VTGDQVNPDWWLLPHRDFGIHAFPIPGSCPIGISASMPQRGISRKTDGGGVGFFLGGGKILKIDKINKFFTRRQEEGVGRQGLARAEARETGDGRSG